MNTILVNSLDAITAMILGGVSGECVSQHGAERRQVRGRRRNSPLRLPLCHGPAQCEPIKRVLPADPSPA